MVTTNGYCYLAALYLSAATILAVRAAASGQPRRAAQERSTNVRRSVVPTQVRQRLAGK